MRIGDIKVWNVIERRISADSKVEIRHTHRGGGWQKIKEGVEPSGFNLIQIGGGCARLGRYEPIPNACFRFLDQ